MISTETKARAVPPTSSSKGGGELELASPERGHTEVLRDDFPRILLTGDRKRN